MKAFLATAALIGGLTPSLALAQSDASQYPPPPPSIYAPYPPVPMPQGSCVWANKVFSSGATFCVTSGAWLTCNLGTWIPNNNADHCNGAPFLRPE
jgi:hypothetical protein